MRVAQRDVAIIGAGTAGLTAYHAARGAGATAVLIERGADGTTCARVGCMPSKLLIAAADAAHAAAMAPHFGIHVDGVVRIDGRAVMGRVRRERNRFVGFVIRDIECIPEADRLRGHAGFMDIHSLEVGGHTRVTASTVVIATGSHPTRDDSFGALGDHLIVSDDVFDWQDLPKSVAVIGPGIIGLELGQALHRLGVHVGLFGRGGRIGPISDPEILAYSIAAFKEELTLEPDAHIADMRRDGDGIAIHRAMPNGAMQIETFDYVLVATGRTPDVHGIDLSNTSMTLDANGVPAYDPETTRTVNANGGKSCPIFIATATGRFLGAEMFAPGGEHLAHLLAWALQNGMTIEQNERHIEPRSTRLSSRRHTHPDHAAAVELHRRHLPDRHGTAGAVRRS